MSSSLVNRRNKIENSPIEHKHKQQTTTTTNNNKMPSRFDPSNPATFPSKKTDYYAMLAAYNAEKGNNQPQENNIEAIKASQRAIQTERCNNRCN